MNEPTRQFAMQKIFLKDLSFESPNSPAVFEGAVQPNIDFAIRSNAVKISDDLYEVVLHVTLTAQQDSGTIFLIELDQAAIFTIRGYDDGELQNLLSGACPAAIFPFARETIWTVVGKGGFPTLLIQPGDLDALMSALPYQAQQNQSVL